MTNAYTYLTDLGAAIESVPPDSIVSRTLFSDDTVKVILFGFAAGQELSEHTASKPALLHFLDGTATLTLGTDTMEANPGTWAHMPANLPHSILAHTQTTMLLLLLEAA